MTGVSPVDYGSFSKGGGGVGDKSEVGVGVGVGRSGRDTSPSGTKNGHWLLLI